MAVAESGSGRFATTQWSVICAARDREDPEAQDALSTLCQVYWQPLYVFIRRQGHDATEAQDLTQEFFTRLIEKHVLEAVDRRKGKFRSFLLASCKHFLSNERDRNHALKRGGDRHFIALDHIQSESNYSKLGSPLSAPEKQFERSWALALLDHVLTRLKSEHVEAGKEMLFESLKPFLVGTSRTHPYSRVAMQLGMSEGSVRVAAHRFRQRYRELLREEIARTVDSPDEIEAEIRDLFDALGT